MFRKLDGRVKRWATLNEPWVVTDGGYLHGALAPGHRNLFEAPIASHNLMRAHGAAVQALPRRWARTNRPRRQPRAQISGVGRSGRSGRDDRADAYMNRQYLDPVFLGRYPEELARDLRRGVARVDGARTSRSSGSRSTSSASTTTRAASRGSIRTRWPVRRRRCASQRATYTETGWEVFAPGLTDTLVWVKERYGNPPLYVTENGAAFFDPPVADGDRARRSAPRRLSAAAHRAPSTPRSTRGVDMRGYIAWSLLDNLEWSLGYSKRFGIVHVDFETQKRTPKDSALFYARVIASNGHVLSDRANNA